MPIYDTTPSAGNQNGVTSFNGRTGAVTPQTGDYTAAQVGAVSTSQVGQPSGIAELDENGLVPASQLPGFVDDVVDTYVVGSTPYAADWLSLTSGGAALTPAASTIYLIVSAGDYQNQQYRWSGTQYALISASLALGETADTAYRGDRGKTAYDHSQITNANPHGVTAAMIGAADADTTDQALQTISDEIDGIIAGTSPITLPVASETKVGGVKVGEGLSVTGDGVLSADSQLPADGTAGQLLGAGTGGEPEWKTLTGADIPVSGEDETNIAAALSEIDTALAGKAPGGFGLGTFGPYVSDLDDALDSGFYTVGATYQNGPAESGAGYSPLLVLAGAGGDRIAQIYYGLNGSYTGSMATRYWSNLTQAWSPWEWFNPPLVSGVEYRTTERYLSRPVYAKVVNFGVAPNATSKTVAHNIENFSQSVSVSGVINGGNLMGQPGIETVRVNKTAVTIVTSTDLSNNTVSVILKYTRNTN